MSDKFDAAAKAWGREKLRAAGITCNEVTSVRYEVVHNSCYCGEYCYCYNDDAVEIGITYKVAGIAGLRFHHFECQLGDLLREVTEW